MAEQYTYGKVLDVVRGLVESIGKEDAQTVAKEAADVKGALNPIKSLAVTAVNKVSEILEVMKDANQPTKDSLVGLESSANFILDTSNMLFTSLGAISAIQLPPWSGNGSPDEKVKHIKSTIKNISGAVATIEACVEKMGDLTGGQSLNNVTESMKTTDKWMKTATDSLQLILDSIDKIDLDPWTGVIDKNIGDKVVYEDKGKWVDEIGTEHNHNFVTKQNLDSNTPAAKVAALVAYIKGTTMAVKSIDMALKVADKIDKDGKESTTYKYLHEVYKDTKNIESSLDVVVEVIKSSTKGINRVVGEMEKIDASKLNWGNPKKGKAEEGTPMAKVNQMAEFITGMGTLGKLPATIQAVLEKLEKSEASDMSAKMSQLADVIVEMHEGVEDGITDIAEAMMAFDLPKEMEGIVKGLLNFNKSLELLSASVDNLIKCAESFDKITYKIVYKAMRGIDTFLDMVDDVLDEIASTIEDFPDAQEMNKRIKILVERMEGINKFFGAIKSSIDVVLSMKDFDPKAFKKKLRGAKSAIINTIKMVKGLIYDIANEIATTITPNEKEQLKLIGMILGPIKTFLDIQNILANTDFGSERKFRKTIKKVKTRIMYLANAMLEISDMMRDLEGINNAAKAVEKVKEIFKNVGEIVTIVLAAGKAMIKLKISLKLITKGWSSTVEFLNQIITDLTSLNLPDDLVGKKGKVAGILKLVQMVRQMMGEINGMFFTSIIVMVTVGIVKKAVAKIAQEFVPEIAKLSQAVGKIDEKAFSKSIRAIKQARKTITKLTWLSLLILLCSPIIMLGGVLAPIMSKQVSKIVQSLNTMTTAINSLQRPKHPQRMKQVRNMILKFTLLMGITMLCLPIILLGSLALMGAAKIIIKAVGTMNRIILVLSALKNPRKATRRMRAVKRLMFAVAGAMLAFMVTLPLIAQGYVAALLVAKMVSGVVRSVNTIIRKLRRIKGTGKARRKIEGVNLLLMQLGLMLVLMIVMLPLIMIGVLASVIVLGGLVLIAIMIRFATKIIAKFLSIKSIIVLALMGLVLMALLVIVGIMGIMGMIPIEKVLMGVLNAVIVIVALLVLAVVLALLGLIAPYIIPLVVPALILIALVALVVLALLLIVVMFWLLGKIKLDEEAIKKNVKMVMDIANYIIWSVFSDIEDPTNEDKTSNEQKGLIGMLGNGVLKVIGALFASMILVLTIISVVAILIIAFLLLILSYLPLDKLMKGKENAVFIAGLAMEVISEVFKDDKTRTNEGDGIFKALVRRFVADLANVIDAIFTVAYLALTVIAVAMILLIGWLLLLVEKMDEKKLEAGRDRAKKVIALANEIIGAVFAPDNAAEEASNRGILGVIINWVFPPLGQLLTAIFSVAYLALAVVSMIMILAIAGILWLIAQFDPATFDAAKVNALKAIETVQAIIGLIFRPDSENGDKSGRGILGTLLSWIMPELASLLTAIFALAYLAVVMVAMLLLLAIAGILWLIAQFDEKTFENAKTNAMLAMETVQAIIALIFKPDDANQDPSGRGVLGTLLSWIMPEMATLLEAIFTLAYLAIVLVAMLLVLAIAGILALIAQIDQATLEQAGINAFLAIQTAQGIIDLVFNPDEANKDGSDRNSGLLGWIGKLCPPLKAFFDMIAAIMSIAKLALMMIAMGIVLGIVRIMADIAKINTGTVKKAATNAKLAVQAGNEIIDAVFQDASTPDKKKGGLIRKILEWVLPSSILQFIDAILAIGKLSMIMSAMGIVMQLADVILKLQNISISPQQAKQKVQNVMDCAWAVKNAVRMGDSVSKKEAESFEGQAKGVLKIFPTFFEIVKNVHRTIDEADRVYRRFNGSSFQSGMEASNRVLDAIKAQVGTINGVTLNSTEFNRKIDSMERMQRLISSFRGASDKDVKNNKQLIDDYCNFLEKIHKTDGVKLKTTEQMMKHMADLAKRINGNFQGLAAALNDHIAPALDRLNTTMDGVTKAQEKIIAELSQPITINLPDSNSTPTDTTPPADSTPADGTAPAADSTGKKEAEEAKKAAKEVKGSGPGGFESGGFGSPSPITEYGDDEYDPIMPESPSFDTGFTPSSTPSGGSQGGSNTAFPSSQINTSKALNNQETPQTGKKYVVSFAEVTEY